ncbi:MAG: SGNH/GDSL hydrolase family protein [Leptospiraceae bacterium]|nr:SGNH/GDSL hydrolase family protein [Leptospiraceae bacterium]
MRVKLFSIFSFSITLFLLFFNIVSSQDSPVENFRFREPNLLESDAFSMIGDSRTQYIFQLGANSDWDSQYFLGELRGECSSNKTTIQNLGIGGSTTRDWIYIFEKEILKLEEISNRVVLMLGGNDAIRLSNKLKNKNDSATVDEELEEIHSRLKLIIQTLLDKGKEVIVQTHFLASPRKKSPSNKIIEKYLIGLNQRIIRDYSENKVEKVSVAIIEPKFPSIFFLDNAHLNQLGFKAHAHYLNLELKKRCWW